MKTAKYLREFILKAPKGPQKKLCDEHDQGEVLCKNHKGKTTVYACVCEAHESTRKRIQESQDKVRERHIVEKGNNSVSHYNLVHKPIPLTPARKTPDAKAAVDQSERN